MDREGLTVAAAADLLGVRRETIYAYVSRGLLHRTYVAAETGRQSLLDPVEVRALAERTRRPRTGRFELQVDTSVSELDPVGRLRYRGHDATALADSESFETVAELLWQSGESDPWTSDERTDEICLQAAAAAPAHTPSADRARVALSLLVARHVGERPLPAARRAIVVAARVLAPTVTAWQTDVAQTAAAALCGPEPSRADVDLIRRALVLLADHELATSTIAARAAAGTQTSMELALLTGAAALGGPLHGQATAAAARTLDRWLVEGTVADEPGGFGHLVYAGPDPRADALIEAVVVAYPVLDDPLRDLSLAVLRANGRFPNVDLGLAALTHALDLPPDSGEGIFLVARLAGLAAHTLEERAQPLRFRPRGLYVG